MSSPLDSTYGFWLITLFLQILLQGCGFLQAWLYFHWYSKDHGSIKAMVAALVVIETFQVVTVFQVTYVYLIDGFGNAPGLLQDSAQLCATYLSAFIVQMYFASCIYVLNKKNKILSSIIVLTAFVAIGSGLAQTIISGRLVSFTQLGSTKPITTLQAAAALICDVVITASLVHTLGKHKGGVRRTNSLLSTLMINAVNRGMLTAVCAALNLILVSKSPFFLFPSHIESQFIVVPGTFYFFIGLKMSGKLYMNSALATYNRPYWFCLPNHELFNSLNSRQHIAKKSGFYEASEMRPSRSEGTSSNTIKLDSVHDDIRIVVTQQAEMERVKTFIFCMFGDAYYYLTQGLQTPNIHGRNVVV
ncbi:hypothetical protein GALMADRAFT_147744 [Galerina marginata CBS 339.88]|uniref:DUF6534 domain-containing protein n=1 Tax=Galerina marginata (strain CBS 339.88) TaxID=685588 RepID=A0A067SIU9_GALM3|nr:hypothetical protein GALMADRAFT_147744 [Galerina marginata CBS 339.88]